EPGVAASATAAARDQHTLTVRYQIGERCQLACLRILVEDQRADRNRNVQVVCAVARLVGSLSVRAAFGFELGMEPEIDQRVLGGCGDDVDRTTRAAVAAVRAAARHKLLATETQAAIAAVAGADVDVHLVDEHLYQYRVWSCRGGSLDPPI